MADFNKILTPGDYENGELNVVIEIPTGSNHKIEWDRENDIVYMTGPAEFSFDGVWLREV